MVISVIMGPNNIIYIIYIIYIYIYLLYFSTETQRLNLTLMISRRRTRALGEEEDLSHCHPRLLMRMILELSRG